jgi:hypothetical protein
MAEERAMAKGKALPSGVTFRAALMEELDDFARNRKISWSVRVFRDDVLRAQFTASTPSELARWMMMESDTAAHVTFQIETHDGR